MSRLGAQDIAIERLRISGDNKSVQSFVRELETSSWPLQLPAHLQHAWVFVRELTVQGKPQQLRSNAAQELQQALANVVSGNAATANASAVRFDSLPQLLAFLIKDVCLGQAASKWYWQRWNYLFRVNSEHSITQLLIENIAELPAVVEQLAGRGQLSLLWKSLSSHSAGTVVQEFGRYCGVNVHTQTMFDANEIIQQQVVNSFPKKSAFLQQWKDFATTSISDKRWQLAAILTGIKYCPMLVVRHPQAVINAFISQIEISGFHGSSRKNISIGELTDRESALNIVGNQPAKKSEVKLSLVDISFSGDKQSMSIESVLEKNIISDDRYFKKDLSEKSSSVQNENSNVSDDLTQSESAREHKLQSPEKNQITTSPEACNEFFTQSGGFLYLINAMRMVITADFLAENMHENGWRWWFDIARLVAQRFDVSLDFPLQHFALTTANANDLQELNDSPISAQAKLLLAQIDEAFSHQPFWQKDNSNSGEFMSIPAHIMADASHIDIYFSLNAVRLDIRLAGLDVNPGWVPWLGRVVRFHYVDSPQLLAGGFSGVGDAH